MPAKGLPAARGLRAAVLAAICRCTASGRLRLQRPGSPLQNFRQPAPQPCQPSARASGASCRDTKNR